jgi:hypothetical protein
VYLDHLVQEAEEEVNLVEISHLIDMKKEIVTEMKKKKKKIKMKKKIEDNQDLEIDLEIDLETDLEVIQEEVIDHPEKNHKISNL